MGMFQKASQVERKLKILAYGSAGKGKTYFGLSFSNAGRMAVIDTEGGTSLYGGKFNFDVLRTKDFATVMKAIEEIKAAKSHDVLMIDPITVLWGTLQDAGQALAEKRANKSSANGMVDVVLTQRDWGIIKRQYNRLMTELVNLPMHVIITAREKDVIGAGERREGVRPDAEKSTPYLPDIILRFNGDKGVYTAVVEKDRSGLYRLNDTITNPCYDSFVKAISHGATVTLQDDEQAATSTAALLEQDEKPAPTAGDQLKAWFAEYRITGDTYVGWCVEQHHDPKKPDGVWAIIKNSDEAKCQLWIAQHGGDITMPIVTRYKAAENVLWPDMWDSLSARNPDVLERLTEMAEAVEVTQ